MTEQRAGDRLVSRRQVAAAIHDVEVEAVTAAQLCIARRALATLARTGSIERASRGMLLRDTAALKTMLSGAVAPPRPSTGCCR